VKNLAFRIMLLISMCLIVNLASQCFAVDNSIVLWLLFNEGSGDTVKDSSNYKNDGKITGAKWVEGYKGSALSFAAGANNFVEIPSSDSLQLSDKGLIIAVWFKTTETAGSDLMFIEKGAWDTGEYALSYPVYANFKVRFQINEICGQQTCQIDSTTGTPALSDNKRHHTAGVYDAVNHKFRVYVDGKLETEQGAAVHKFTPDNQSVFLGTRNRAGNWYVGVIDDLLVAKVPFTDEQIKKHMDGNLMAVGSADKLAKVWGEIKIH